MLCDNVRPVVVNKIKRRYGLIFILHKKKNPLILLKRCSMILLFFNSLFICISDWFGRCLSEKKPQKTKASSQPMDQYNIPFFGSIFNFRCQ